MMRMVMTLTMPHSNFKRNWKPTGQSVSNYILKLKGGGSSRVWEEGLAIILKGLPVR